jgi:lipopolysaccharide biosynthesis regulator YciM
LAERRFFLTADASIPVYGALLAVFLAGLLPPATLLLVRSLRQDLSRRRERRRLREAESLEQRYRRAVDFQTDGQWAKAASELEILLTERPEDYATLLRYGEVLRRQGKKQEALEVHRRASVLYPQAVALLYQLAEDYQALGEEQVAHEIRNRILRDFPGQGLQVMRRRRDRAMDAGDWEEAVRWHDRVEQLLRDTGDAAALDREAGTALGLTYQRGVALLEQDRPAEGAEVFRRILESEPRFIPAGIMRGEAELLRDDEAAALAAWQEGFRVTGSPVFLKRIEDYFIEVEDPARVIEILRRLIAESDNDLLPRFFLGRLYYRLEMHDEALKMLRGVGERLDPSPTYHYLLGRLRQRRGDLAGAVDDYLVCLKGLGVSHATFVCRNCGLQLAEWHDRCDRCGSWSSVDFDLEEEQLSPEELGLAERPVWGGREEELRSGG